MRGRARDGVRHVAYLLALAAVLMSSPGWGSGRVALVVGNGGYAEAGIPALANPVNDARLMANALETSGFEVRLVTDADQAAMKAAIEAFGKQLLKAGEDSVGLFYYAGHGVEVRGDNYLIPLAADIENEVEFKTDAVPADWVLSWMGAARNRLNMVILDACRNNPFEGRYRGGSGQGLAEMNAPSGSYIAYSAAPNQVALDGEGDNSPYTAALAKTLVEPGLKVEEVFKRVRIAVEEATNGEQTPWESSSLRGDFHFVAKVEEPPSPEPQPRITTDTKPPKPITLELATRAYEAAERVHTASAYQLVVDRFPDTFYAALAREQIVKLKSVPAPPTPPRPSAEKVEASLALSREQRKQVQIGLRAVGFNPGSPDGKFGERTREAIRKWQASLGEVATGYLDADVAETLLKAGEAVPPTPPSKEAREARDLLYEALALGRSNDLGFFVLQGIAVAQAKVGDTYGALETAGNMKNDWEREAALPAVAKALAKAGDFQGALTAARRLSSDSDWGSASALRNVVKALAKAGDTDGAARSIAEALRTARGISYSGVRARALSHIAEAQVKAGDTGGAARSIAEALRAAQRYRDDVDDDDEFLPQMLRDLAKAQAKVGDIHGALGTARSIDSTVSVYGAYALRDIAEAQAKAGDIHGALGTARSIRGLGHANSAYTSTLTLTDIAETQTKAGDIQGTARSFAEALGAVRSINNARDRTWALHNIAEAQAKAGDTQGAARSITEALSAARSIGNAETRANALRDIAVTQAKVGDIHGALGTARSIDSTGYRAWALRDIAEAQAKAGDVHGALGTARSIGGAWSRASALRDIAVAQAKAGDIQGAARSFAEALGAARNIDDARYRASALSGIAPAQAKSGDTHGAAKSIAEALSTARSISDARKLASALRDIAVAKVNAANQP